ncbi:MAG: methyltransferase domain-containing protein [Burkholderiaceae bacterium]
MSIDTSLGPAAIKQMATKLYADTGTLKARLMQRYRSYICPLQEVIREVPPKASVMDVGCGHGLLLNLLAHLGRIRRGHGFDMARPAVEVANTVAKIHSFAPDVEFEVRSVEQGIPRLGFEIVTVIDVLHHIPDAHKHSFVCDLCEAVPNGGRLIIKDMVVKPRWRALANQIHDLVMARQWVEQVGPESIETWAAEKGLRVVRRGTFNTLWYGHWLLVLQKGGAEPG